MSCRDRENTSQNRESLAKAREALRNLPKDQERIIREAHARLLAERAVRK